MTLLRPWLETDFSLGPKRGLGSLLIACAAGLGFGAWMALADSTAFAGIIPASQTRLFEQTPLAVLLPGIGYLVLYDEIVLRLLAMPVLAWLLHVVTGRRSGIIRWTSILVTACLFWPLSSRGYIGTLDWSALTLLREVVLHCAAGTLWGWLCWRHGWVSGLVGHLSAYGTLLPLLII